MNLKINLGNDMFTADYIIAGHRIRMKGLKLLKALNSMKGFDLFIARNEGNPEWTFISAETDEYPTIPPTSKILFAESKDGFKSNFAKRPEGSFIFESSSAKGETVVFETDQETDTTFFYGDFSEELLRFALWLAYGIAVVPTMTLSLHSSSVLYKDKVILFLGESGTGKSTHTRLWINHIEGAELFNDDSPILRVENKKMIVYGGPWSGKTPCYRTDSYPLAACVRLYQAPFNKIDRLTKLEAYTALHPSCPPEFAYDDRLYDFVSEFLGDLISNVPVFKMGCLPDADAARISCEAIYGSCLPK